jgi:hypothetical protein
LKEEPEKSEKPVLVERYQTKASKHGNSRFVLLRKGVADWLGREVYEVSSYVKNGERIVEIKSLKSEHE